MAKVKKMFGGGMAKIAASLSGATKAALEKKPSSSGGGGGGGMGGIAKSAVNSVRAALAARNENEANNRQRGRGVGGVIRNTANAIKNTASKTPGMMAKGGAVKKKPATKKPAAKKTRAC